jgi:hypothetical protein
MHFKASHILAFSQFLESSMVLGAPAPVDISVNGIAQSLSGFADVWSVLLVPAAPIVLFFYGLSFY